MGNQFLETVALYDEAMKSVPNYIQTGGTELDLDRLTNKLGVTDTYYVVETVKGCYVRTVDNVRTQLMANMKLNKILERLEENEFSNDFVEALFRGTYFKIIAGKEGLPEKAINLMVGFLLTSMGFYDNAVIVPNNVVDKLNKAIKESGYDLESVPYSKTEGKTGKDYELGAYNVYPNFEGNKYYELIKPYRDIYLRYTGKFYAGGTNKEFEDFKRNEMGLTVETDHKLRKAIDNLYYLEYDNGVIEALYASINAKVADKIEDKDFLLDMAICVNTDNLILNYAYLLEQIDVVSLREKGANKELNKRLSETIDEFTLNQGKYDVYGLKAKYAKFPILVHTTEELPKEAKDLAEAKEEEIGVKIKAQNDYYTQRVAELEAERDRLLEEKAKFLADNNITIEEAKELLNQTK